MRETHARARVAAGAHRAFDYVLAVGPSRSGTTFLYRHLNAHPAFAAPDIKEAHYYRSARRLARALGSVRGAGAVLLDVADTAWSDPRLAAVSALVESGLRVLVVVVLRRHRDRARSLMAYRKSRVLPALPALLAGRGGLERAAVRDSLSPAALERVFGLGADVLVVEFGALVGEPGRVLDAVAGLCGTPSFGRIDAEALNRAETARFVPLAAAAKLAAAALRAAGARRALQALKDDPRLVRLVFRPASPSELPVLSEAAAACLDRREAACRAAVDARCEPFGAGLWLARGAHAGALASDGPGDPVPALDKRIKTESNRQDECSLSRAGCPLVVSGPDSDAAHTEPARRVLRIGSQEKPALQSWRILPMLRGRCPIRYAAAHGARCWNTRYSAIPYPFPAPCMNDDTTGEKE